jgi:hypothetical protein
VVVSSRAVTRLFAVVLLLGTLAFDSATATADGPALTFTVGATLHYGTGACPGSPSGISCYPYTGNQVISGLGGVSFAFDVAIDRSTACGKWLIPDGTLSASKGTLSIVGASQTCQSSAEGAGGVVDFRFSGGTGSFVGAAGDGVATFGSANQFNQTGYVQWRGTLDVNGYSFDTTPPTFNSSGTRVVRIKRGRGTRVRYAIGANDAVDGAVAVTCTPRSGSFFKVGKTWVVCSATDTSGNTGTTRFLVVVSRRH